MTTEINEIKKAHNALVSTYVDQLNLSTRLPLLVKLNAFIWSIDMLGINFDISALRPTPQSLQVARNNLWGKLFVWMYDRIISWPMMELWGVRYLVSLFVSSHIKAKLTELAASYLYQAQKYGGSDDESKQNREWLVTTSETCEKLAGTLASFQSIQGVISAFWPIIIGFVASLTGVETLKDAIAAVDIRVIISWSLFILSPILYLLILMITSFLYKRQMFTGYDPITELKSYIKSQEITDIELLSTEKNIYLLENRLFLLLGRSKTGEFPWDLFIFPITISGMLLFWEWPKNFVISDWKLIALSAIFFVFALAIKRRKWY